LPFGRDKDDVPPSLRTDIRSCSHSHVGVRELDTAYGTAMVGGDESADFQDVTCSFCGRHNREVHVVAHDDLVICQVCVAKCADIFDTELGLSAPPDGWASRWPLKS
jgi:ClpX C4-type zinc finger